MHTEQTTTQSTILNHPKQADMKFWTWHRERIFSVSMALLQKYCGDSTISITLLDSGCGIGENAQHILQLPQITLYGVDISFDCVQAAVNRIRDINATSRAMFIQASIEDMTFFSDHSFEVIYDYGLLSLVAHPYKVFAEYKRLLKPGGHILFSIPPKWSIAHLSYLFRPSDEEWKHHPSRWNNLKFWKRLHHMHFYSEAEVCAILDASLSNYQVLEKVILWYYYFDQQLVHRFLDKLAQRFGISVFDRIDGVLKHCYRIPSGAFWVLRVE